MRRAIQFAAAVLCLLALAVVCYLRPLAEDFDRYIYEALVLGKSQSLHAVYEHVKHESPRAEQSSVLDSPEHLKELEPLYAIRPFYLEIIALLGAFLPIQRAIGLISAASLFGVGIVVLAWTKKPLQSALLMAAYPVMVLGRMGTPDALAALLAIAALWLIAVQHQDLIGIILLLLSLGVRTDNVLIVIAVYLWLLREGRLSVWMAGLGSVASVAVVLIINHYAGSYSWIVLFRYSFIAGRYPAQIPHTLTIHEYVAAFFRGFSVILTQISLWLLIGIWAWIRKPTALLLMVAAVLAAHFILFPSPEVRYLMWGCMVAAILLIQSFDITRPDETQRRTFAKQGMS